MAQRCPWWLRGTAYHEAGHVVFAMAQGRPVIEVAVADDGDGENFGGTVYGPRPESDLSFRERVWNAATLALAGPVAEVIATGIENPEGAADDLADARRLALLVCKNDADAAVWLADVRRHLDRLTRGAWCVIEPVAEALIERRRLSGEEVRQVILDAPEPEPEAEGVTP
jgi:hypothetical protein